MLCSFTFGVVAFEYTTIFDHRQYWRWSIVVTPYVSHETFEYTILYILVKECPKWACASVMLLVVVKVRHMQSMYHFYFITSEAVLWCQCCLRSVIVALPGLFYYFFLYQRNWTRLLFIIPSLRDQAWIITFHTSWTHLANRLYSCCKFFIDCLIFAIDL